VRRRDWLLRTSSTSVFTGSYTVNIKGEMRIQVSKTYSVFFLFFFFLFFFFYLKLGEHKRNGSAIPSGNISGYGTSPNGTAYVRILLSSGREREEVSKAAGLCAR